MIIAIVNTKLAVATSAANYLWNASHYLISTVSSDAKSDAVSTFVTSFRQEGFLFPE